MDELNFPEEKEEEEQEEEKIKRLISDKIPIHNKHKIFPRTKLTIRKSQSRKIRKVRLGIRLNKFFTNKERKRIMKRKVTPEKEADLLLFGIDNNNSLCYNENIPDNSINELWNQENAFEDEILKPEPLIRIPLLSETNDTRNVIDFELIDSKNIEFPNSFYELSSKQIQDVLGISPDSSTIGFENIFNGIQENPVFNAFKNVEQLSPFEERRDNIFDLTYSNQNFNNLYDILISGNSIQKADSRIISNSPNHNQENVSPSNKIEMTKEMDFNRSNNFSDQIILQSMNNDPNFFQGNNQNDQ